MRSTSLDAPLYWTALVAFFSCLGFLVMVLKNNSSSSVSTSDETMRMNDQYHLGSSSASSHTHPLSDASRLARDKFERGQWRFEDRPKPLSKPQSEEVRFLGWTLYEESGRDHANRKMQRREEMERWGSWYWFLDNRFFNNLWIKSNYTSISNSKFISNDIYH